MKLGRGASIDGDTNMLRELIEIEAVGNGWVVKDAATIHACPTKAGAIGEGQRLAERRHRETGHPTALKVPVGWGEAILVGAYG